LKNKKTSSIFCKNTRVYEFSKTMSHAIEAIEEIVNVGLMPSASGKTEASMTRILS
jgi:hypothetical protein